MKDINKVIIVGRLGADPVRRQTKTAGAVVNFSVATTRRRTKEKKPLTVPEVRDVEDKVISLPNETQWHNIVCWGKQGENCALYLKKGNLVYVEGTLRCYQYEDKQGLKKMSVEIYAETVSFLSAARNQSITESLPEAAAL